jgi:renalase
MRVAVIGAGLSGLAAAARLTETGHQVRVFEKSRGLGGRLATRRTSAGPVDHGCPAVDIGGSPDLAARLAQVAPDGTPAPAPGAPCRDGAFPLGRPLRWESGVTAPAKRLADGLDVVLGTRIAALRCAGDGLELGDEQGNPRGHVDAVIVSAPAPQAADLLAHGPADEARIAALRAVIYRPALVVVLAYPDRADIGSWLTHPADGPAIRVVVGGPPDEDGDATVVVTLDPVVSARLLDLGTDAKIADLAAEAAAGAGVAGNPSWTQVKRWRFAVTGGGTPNADLNPPGARILLCGDAVSGPGLGAVYESGIAAADRAAALA